MIRLRLAVPAVLIAAAVAGCFTYFVASPAQVEADQLSPRIVPILKGPDTTASTGIDQRTSEKEKAAAAFERAAEAILKRAQNAKASAGTDEPPIMGHIPLPKRRPITHP